MTSTAEITATLRAAIPLLRQRNLDRAVLLARQAAEGRPDDQGCSANSAYSSFAACCSTSGCT